MDKQKLTRQLEMLHRDLSSADKRAKKISKECGLPDNELIEFAMEQTKLVLEYIESLKGEKDNE
jgi:uncharacterized protein YpmB